METYQEGYSHGLWVLEAMGNVFLRTFLFFLWCVCISLAVKNNTSVLRKGLGSRGSALWHKLGGKKVFRNH